MKWFNNLKIRTKLLFGFIIVALVGGAIGVAGYSGLTKLNNELTEISDNRMVATSALDQILQGQLEVMVGVRGLLNPMFDAQAAQGLYDIIDQGFGSMGEAWIVYEALPKGDVQRDMFQTLSGQFADWQSANEYLLTLTKAIDQELNMGKAADSPEVVEMFRDAINYYEEDVTPKRAKTEQTLETIIARNKEMVQEAKDIAQAAYKSSLLLLVSFAGAGIVISILLGIIIANLISKPIGKMAELASLMALGHVDLEVTVDSKDEVGDLMRHFGAVLETTKENTSLLEQMAIGDLNVEVRPRSDKDVLSFSLQRLIEANKVQEGVAESLAVGDLTIDVQPRSEKDAVSIAIQQMIQNLKNIIAEVQEATDQVAAAADQISSGSQALAQGAAEQASSLEEVSSSLEEITSMTRTNADNAEQAQSLSQAASHSAVDGRSAMDNMNKAIAEIKTASDETARIIKTIDDIAFQTNLLALNAAVEAARAGEAGRGFAVVSEEVRNLALRSAEAAKETALMIEESVKRSDNGVKIAEDVHKSLLEITDGTEKVKEFVAEIAAASQEQSRGIDQITVATAQMNKVTQESAANAEEGASGAEELASQVAQLRDTLEWFKVEEKRHSGSKHVQTGKRDSGTKKKQFTEKSERKQVHTKSAAAASRLAKTHVIPLDDDEDFEGF